jgi:hypothetical protein
VRNLHEIAAGGLSIATFTKIDPHLPKLSNVRSSLRP